MGDTCFKELKTMKSTIPVTVFSLILVILLSVSLIVCSKPQSVSQSNSETPIQQETAYQIRDYNGHVSVYKSGEAKPFMVLETFTSLLPEYDQRQLSTSGVTVHSYSELVNRIEDYIS
ncbi:MAG: hypothetical protein ACLRVT_04365 [Oscillospiraceae bacterium]